MSIIDSLLANNSILSSTHNNLVMKLNEQTVGSESYYMMLRELHGAQLAINENDLDICNARPEKDF
jgi:hypothetical protein